MPRLHGVVLACWLAAAPALAQGPDAEWRTLVTPHFRVHYTAPAEAWTLRAASRLEAIRDRVIAEVGYAPPETVDVIVADPLAQSNGAAFPVLGWPRLMLWTSPPGPGSGLSDYTDWSDLLVVHEETHLVHLLRPSRSPFQRVIEALLPVGPITLRAPRWVHEGYATLVEGRLTGSGRPNGDLRAAVLRQRARAGKLPSYGQMASDSQTWLGMSMAYLAGSAYLEWLEQRAGPHSLEHLWARMTARPDRSFDAAFEGVFGEAPEKLYGRFTAELTWRAMEAERRLAPFRREGESWQELQWTTGEPDVSPDGTLLAIVLRDRKRPSRLVLLPTARDEKVEGTRLPATARASTPDAQDFPAVQARPPARKPVFELVTRDHEEPFSPRFTADGKSLLLVRFEPDGEGFLHPDLFRWTPATGRVARVTRLADVRDPDPAPDGSWAVAVRDRDGLSQLVRVDLASGAVAPLTPPSLDVVYALPRIAPDGRRLAYVRHENAAWRMVVRDLASGREVVAATPAGAMVSYPAWSADGAHLFASLGRRGFVDVVRLDPDGGGIETVTVTAGAALAPAPTPDGKAVFFLALEAEGLTLRRLELGGVAPREPAAGLVADLAPAVRPSPPPAPAPFAAAEVRPGAPYGLGHQELLPIAGASLAPSGRGAELGARVGDVVGRLDVLALGALGDAAGPRGGTLAATWRGWPVSVSLQLFSADVRPSRQPREVAGLGASLDVDRRGALLSAGWRYEWRVSALDLGAGLLASRVEPVDAASVSERAGFVRAGLSRTPTLGRWRFPQSLVTSFTSGSTDGALWRRYGGAVAVGVDRDSSGLRLAWRRDAVRDAPLPFDRVQLGGVASSILPEAAAGARVLDPALPAGTRVGDDHESETATLTVNGLPLFFARHRVWSANGPRGDWLRLAGVEWDIASGPWPIIRLPAGHLRLGVARVLDPPLRDSTQAWLSLAWRP